MKSRFNTIETLNFTITYNRSKYRVEDSWSIQPIMRQLSMLFNKKKFQDIFYEMYLVPERFTNGDSRWYHYHGQMLLHHMTGDIHNEIAGAINGLFKAKIGNISQSWNDPEIKEECEYPTYYDYCFKLNEFGGYWRFHCDTVEWIACSKSR